uniref:Uncharacterized protein n=1 Tax=Arundo donax TaxID=35708 RepID=A0A0A9SCD4_ARUDO
MRSINPAAFPPHRAPPHPVVSLPTRVARASGAVAAALPGLAVLISARQGAAP